MEALNVDSSLFFQLVIFLCFVFLANQLLFRPTLPSLQKRVHLTTDRFHQAELLSKESSLLKEEYGRAYRKEEVLAQQKVKEAREAILRQQRGLLEEARLHSRRVLVEKRNEILERMQLVRTAFDIEGLSSLILSSLLPKKGG